MSLTNSPIWFGSGATGGGFYDYEINDSLRFNDDDSAYLNRTPSSAGNRKTWTWSSWVKRGNLSSAQYVFFAYNGNSDAGFFRIEFNSADTIRVRGWGTTYLETSAVYRDTSAWYHIVLVADTTQSQTSSSASDSRIRLYVNGEQVTAFSSASMPSQNTDLPINNNIRHNLSSSTGYSSANYFDGYLSDVHFIDGTALDPTSFGETKSGVWIPKAYGGSYGTNGFHLDFSNNSTATNLGLDSSGNSNNWSVNGIATTDQMIDTPTNNFATLNPLDNTGQILSEGNLKFYNNASSHKGVRGSFGMASGQWYFECSMSSISGGDQQQFGLARQNVTCPTNGSAGDTFMIYSGGGNPSNIYIYNDGTSLGNTAQSVAVGDVFKCAYDADTGKLWLGKNSDWYNSSGAVDGSANPATGTNPTMTLSETEPLVTWVHSYSNAGTYNICNFGQDGTFAGNITAGGNADSNGVGDFKYSVPSGYLALCTANLPEPVVGPLGDSISTDNFNPVLFTGNGSTQSITGVGFQPDFVWAKTRSPSGYGHSLFDVVRGGNERLDSSSTQEERDYEGNISFQSDGFNVTSSYPTINNNTSPVVAWNWKAGGTASSNTDGSITSQVSANTDAGFSIVSYTGNGSSSATVGHGLAVAPSMLIVKRRNASGYGWNVYHSAVGAGKVLFLDQTGAAASTSLWNSTAPTSSVFNLGTSNGANGSGGTYIAYCFSDVEGFSKAGSYTGNGSNDGPFIYLGFRPSLFLTKRTDSTSDWQLLDTARDTYNAADVYLKPNSSIAETEGGDHDFVSNGFKIRNSGGSQNASGGTYIFLAFAENPFKYANAR